MQCTRERNGIYHSYTYMKQRTKNIGNATDDNVQLIIWREDSRHDAVSLVLSGILVCTFRARRGTVSSHTLLFASLAAGLLM